MGGTRAARERAAGFTGERFSGAKRAGLAGAGFSVAGFAGTRFASARSAGTARAGLCTEFLKRAWRRGAGGTFVPETSSWSGRSPGGRRTVLRARTIGGTRTAGGAGAIRRAPAVLGARMLIPLGWARLATRGPVEGRATFGCLAFPSLFAKFLAARRCTTAALPGFCIGAMGTSKCRTLTGGWMGTGGWTRTTRRTRTGGRARPGGWPATEGRTRTGEGLAFAAAAFGRGLGAVGSGGFFLPGAAGPIAVGSGIVAGQLPASGAGFFLKRYGSGGGCFARGRWRLRFGGVFGKGAFDEEQSLGGDRHGPQLASGRHAVENFADA